MRIDAVWPACSRFPGRVRLEAEIGAPACAIMTGRLVSRGTIPRRRGFTARLPLCGDAPVDGAEREPCEEATRGVVAPMPSWMNPGSGGQLRTGSGIAVDAAGDVLVLDGTGVRRLDAGGNLRAAWGGTGHDPGEFFFPGAMAMSGVTLYVADSQNHRVQRFRADGHLLGTWGTPCLVAAGSLGGCVDPDGSGPAALGDGQFYAPIGIATDGEGSVYVADTFNHRIQRFTSSGDFVARWGSGCSLIEFRGEGCVDPDGPGPRKRGDGQFDAPVSVAADHAGNVYVADLGNRRVQKFDSTGRFLAKWRRVGRGRGFVRPAAVAVDGAGDVYVGDSDHVHVFDPWGTHLGTWGSTVTGHGGGDVSGELAIDRQGNIYALFASGVWKFARANRRVRDGLACLVPCRPVDLPPDRR